MPGMNMKIIRLAVLWWYDYDDDKMKKHTVDADYDANDDDDDDDDADNDANDDYEDNRAGCTSPPTPRAFISFYNSELNSRLQTDLTNDDDSVHFFIVYVFNFQFYFLFTTQQ